MIVGGGIPLKIGGVFALKNRESAWQLESERKNRKKI